MDENRLVDLLLVGILVLGTAVLIGLYFLKPFHQEVSPASSTIAAERAALNDRAAPGSRVSLQFPKHPESGQHEENETSGGVAHPSQEPETASAPRKTSQTNDELDRGGRDRPSVDRSTTGVSDALAASGDGFAEPAERVFQETSKANGNFYLAQEIKDGVTTGNRGSVNDRADFYRIVAEGDRMILEMNPSLSSQEHGLILAVFDANRTLMESHSKDMKGIQAFAVKPQSAYYIKVDLRKTPVEATPYRLRIRFD